MKKRIIFLGYSSKKTKLIKFLKKKNNTVIEYGNREINNKIVKEADLLISFGYRKIIKKNFLKNSKRPIINLHGSYLPYNRGAHPNFWSFITNSPKGITIHEVDEKVDMGEIIYRKRVYFKKIPNLTFEKTYEILINEIEKLFIKNYKKILSGDYTTKKIRSQGTFHKSSDLPKNLKSWNIKISDFKKNYKI